jgi:galactokinase/mevalonate kinase-like predicted kinase
MYGGSVLSISTQERAQCLLAPADSLHVTSSDEQGILRTRDDLVLRGDKLDILRAALTYFQVDPAAARFSLRLSTEIPMQAGMAGSTALIVTLVGVLNRHLGTGLRHSWEIAETARKIEARILGVVCGFQDQHMAAFGGLNFMDFHGKQSLEQAENDPLATVEPLHPYAPAVPLLSANTGVRHHSGTVHRSPRERYLAGEPLVVESYAAIAELARQAKPALLRGDWQTLGRLMNENHALVAALGGSGEANERLIAAALAAGAYGAKLAGAGGGGTILVLTDDMERMRHALREAGATSLATPVPAPGLTLTETDQPD